MNMRNFAEGFERDPVNYSSLSSDQWQSASRSLMGPSARWSRFFGQLVDSHLSEQDVDSDEVAASLKIYTSHTGRQLLLNIDDTIRNIAFHNQSLAPHLNHLNFHTVNQEVTPYWKRLVAPEEFPAPDYIDLTVMQTRLAVRALQLVETREALHDMTIQQNPLPSEEELFVDSAYAGRITEVEAMMGVLEVIKNEDIEARDNLVAVPAPIGYDQTPSRDKSSDILLLDIEQRQALGVQVKTTLRGKRHYDQRFVSFIDGVSDLGNVSSRTLASGKVVQKAHPGLMSIDFILNNEALQRQSAFSRIEGLVDVFGQIRHAKEFAEMRTDKLDYTGRIERAAKIIGPRLLFALYEDTSEPDQIG